MGSYDRVFLMGSVCLFIPYFNIISALPIGFTTERRLVDKI